MIFMHPLILYYQMNQIHFKITCEIRENTLIGKSRETVMFTSSFLNNLYVLLNQKL